MPLPIKLVYTCLFLNFLSFEVKAQVEDKSYQIFEVSYYGRDKMLAMVKDHLQNNPYIARRFFCEERSALYIEAKERDTAELMIFFHDIQLPCELKKNCDFERILQLCSVKSSQKD
jgi:hypothetical protein